MKQNISLDMYIKTYRITVLKYGNTYLYFSLYFKLAIWYNVEININLTYYVVTIEEFAKDNTRMEDSKWTLAKKER